MIVSCAVTQTKMMAKCNKREEKKTRNSFLLKGFFIIAVDLFYIYIMRLSSSSTL